MALPRPYCGRPVVRQIATECFACCDLNWRGLASLMKKVVFIATKAKNCRLFVGNPRATGAYDPARRELLVFEEDQGNTHFRFNKHGFSEAVRGVDGRWPIPAAKGA